MLKGKWKLLICIALVTCVLFGTSNSVFAAINEGYLSNAEVKEQETVLNEKVSKSSLLDAIGALIYGVGSLMEWILGKMFELITGTNMFPWADAILFNAVPFLDVNIFTGAKGSLVSILYDFLTGTYYSLLTLASAFFGIAVMFSAVKLAITAIAEDKARYKKAIVDWLLGLVMLWGMHFFISFVLYLNEQLVVVASSIAKEEIRQSASEIVKLSDSSSENQEQVWNFIDKMSNGYTTKRDKILSIVKIVAIVVAVVAGIALIVFTAGTAIPAAMSASGTLAALGTGASFFAKVAAVGPAIAAFAKVTLGTTLLIGGSVITFTTLEIVNSAEYIISFKDKYDTVRKEQIDDLAETFKDKDEMAKAAFDLYSIGTTRTFTYYDKNLNEVTKTVEFNIVDVTAGLLKNSNYINGYGLPFATSDGSNTFVSQYLEKGVSESER